MKKSILCAELEAGNIFLPVTKVQTLPVRATISYYSISNNQQGVKSTLPSQSHTNPSTSHLSRGEAPCVSRGGLVWRTLPPASSSATQTWPPSPWPAPGCRHPPPPRLHVPPDNPHRLGEPVYPPPSRPTRMRRLRVGFPPPAAARDPGPPAGGRRRGDAEQRGGQRARDGCGGRGSRWTAFAGGGEVSGGASAMASRGRPPLLAFARFLLFLLKKPGCVDS